MADYDERIVALYDLDNPDGPDHDFYRSLAALSQVKAILDVGCDTGILTVTLAAGGRRVVGVDPSPAMLAFARRRPGADGVEWIDGDSQAAPRVPFDLAVMTGNVAQHLPEAHWGRTLRDLRARMADGGTVRLREHNLFGRQGGRATPSSRSRHCTFAHAQRSRRICEWLALRWRRSTATGRAPRWMRRERSRPSSWCLWRGLARAGRRAASWRPA